MPLTFSEVNLVALRTTMMRLAAEEEDDTAHLQVLVSLGAMPFAFLADC